MRLLETWVETPLASAAGWALLQSLWEGAIISAALAAALMVVRSPRARYAAACVAMLVMLGAFGITLMRAMPEGAEDCALKRCPPFIGTCQPSVHLRLWIRTLPRLCPGSRRSGLRASGSSTWGR